MKFDNLLNIVVQCLTMNNIEFLKAIFGNDYIQVHVTDFKWDPFQIPVDLHLSAWKGDYLRNYKFKPKTNQYFTISTFHPDENGVARRRKALYQKTHVIVLDDVREKLSIEAVNRLPSPSYILETSPGSEQWGYILNEPCTDRNKVENLLNGLVANGLAPGGKDPGMRGVTRYVRLPEGYNTKESKMIDGKPFKCQILDWQPYLTTTIEELAQPFNVDLNYIGRDKRVDGAFNVPDHPLLNTEINVKEIRSPGRYDITCPWIDEHTNQDDSGTAFFTNQDGTLGFSCHHGHCQHRTAKHLLEYLEEQSPGFEENYRKWFVNHSFKDIPEIVKEDTSFDLFLEKIKKEIPGSARHIHLCTEFLKLVDTLSEIERIHRHNNLCDINGWTKNEFAKILKDLRQTWCEKKEDVLFYNRFIFIRELDQFYDFNTGIFFTPGAFQNSFSSEDSEAKKEALMGGKVDKVDKMDFAPKMPKIFEEKGIIYGNTWTVTKENKGSPGNCSPWLDHFDVLGWSSNKKHILQFMAYTILHPENKINHILLFGGLEGIGKDFLLKPLIQALGEYAETINGDILLTDFNDYLLSTKYLHINETELGDHKESDRVSARLKPLATAPPDKLRVNPKNLKAFSIRNIVNVTMTTNSQSPIKLIGPSRRFYAVWSDLNMRNGHGDISPKWKEYWRSIWIWIKNGGIDHCIYYLRNCVDLSDFEPGAAPDMTEFLANIQEASKSPMQQTIEAFIQNKIGCFKSDIVTANDASTTLKAGILGSDEFMYSTPMWFTPTKVGRIMRDISSCVKIRAKGETDLKPWIVRNREKYDALTTSELHDEYKRQMKNTKDTFVQLR